VNVRDRRGTGCASADHRMARATSIGQSETIRRPAEAPSRPPIAGDEAYRRLLRAFLTAQVEFERAQSLRQTLLFALTATSLVLWVFTAWPELLGVPARSLPLGVWFLLFAAALYTWGVELLWLRRSNDAHRHIRATTASPTTEDVNDGGKP
jgi:hypothetical protein